MTLTLTDTGGPCNTGCRGPVYAPRFRIAANTKCSNVVYGMTLEWHGFEVERSQVKVTGSISAFYTNVRTITLKNDLGISYRSDMLLRLKGQRSTLRLALRYNNTAWVRSLWVPFSLDNFRYSVWHIDPWPDLTKIVDPRPGDPVPSLLWWLQTFWLTQHYLHTHDTIILLDTLNFAKNLHLLCVSYSKKKASQ